MAWPVGGPRTWNPGETVTATQMNEQLRDALNVLKTNIDDEGGLKTVLFVDSVARVSSGTGATEASTYTLLAAKLEENGMAIRLRAWGKGGASGTFTFRFYWNGSSIHNGIVTAANGIWQAEAIIMRTGASLQSALAWSGAIAAGINTATPAAMPSLNTTVWDTLAADLSMEVAIKTELQASANTLTQLGLIIEFLTAGVA